MGLGTSTTPASPQDRSSPKAQGYQPPSPTTGMGDANGNTGSPQFMLPQMTFAMNDYQQSLAPPIAQPMQPAAAPAKDYASQYANAPASTRAFMAAPGSALMDTINQQTAASNAAFANEGVSDPFGYALSHQVQGAQNPAAAQSASTSYNPQATQAASGQPQTTGAQPVAPRPMDMGGGVSQLPPGQMGNANQGYFSGQLNADSIANAINSARDSAYRQATGYLDPQFQNQEQTLRASLANQGIPQGSEAWQKSMDEFQRNKAFAYGQARDQAFGQGLTAQNQAAQQMLGAMGLDTSRYGTDVGANTTMGVANIGAQTAANQLNEQRQQDLFGNSMNARQQYLNELLLQQQNPLQMYNALMGGGMVSTPQFTNAPGTSVNPTDISGIYNNALAQQNNVYNSQVGAQNSQTTGAAMVLAALLSDRRLKTDVRKIGMHVVGVPLYTYRYLWGEPGIGVMADELERVRPDAVFTTPSGFKAVDYGRL